MSEEIIQKNMVEIMRPAFLNYALSVIGDRALANIRDGMKPVQLRILYSAYCLNAFPEKPFYKCARIVGDVLGKYHPHGI